MVLIFGSIYSTGKDVKTCSIGAGMWSLIACFAYFKPHKDDIYLVNGEYNLVFYRDIPNEKAVIEFIDGVKDQVKAYMKKKYTVFDSTTSDQDFYRRLNWLRDTEIISFSEYDEIKTNYDTQKLL